MTEYEFFQYEVMGKIGKIVHGGLDAEFNISYSHYVERVHNWVIMYM